MDNVYGTSVNAHSAACALGVIKNGEVVVHCDRAVGASACALGTSDASVGAHLAGERALIVVGATDSNDRSVFNHLDGGVRTGLCAESATRAESGDYGSNTVVDYDSVVGTSRRTVTKTDAGVCTNVFAFPMFSSLAAGLETVAEVLFVLLGSLAGSVTSNVSKYLDGLARLNTENGCDSLRSCVATGNAEIGLADLAFGECAGVAVASAEAASTAVSSGKSITDGKELFVLLNTEEDVRNGKNDRANSRDSETDKNRDNNFHCLLPPYARRFSTIPAKP